MAILTIRIHNGKAVITADGTAVSCKAATDLERALGGKAKRTPTGTKPVDQKVSQR